MFSEMYVSVAEIGKLVQIEGKMKATKCKEVSEDNNMIDTATTIQ